MNEITAVGEILIDLTQTGTAETGVPLFAANPGGAPANVAVAASRLGAKTAFLGAVGADGFGTYLRSVLEHDHVDCSGLIVKPQATTMAIVAVDETGERSFRFVRGADAELSVGDWDDSLSTKVLHFGSVSLTQNPARDATLSTARSAHAAGALVSYDPNYRPALWHSQQEAIDWMTRPLPLVDILKISEEELPLLTGVSDLEEGTRLLAEQGVSLIFVTLGGAGSFCRWQGETFTVPGVSVSIADTNGAGDTFFGAALSQLCRRGDHPLAGLTRAELEPILTFANRAAALTCSRSGAIPAMPYRAELEDAT